MRIADDRAAQGEHRAPGDAAARAQGRPPEVKVTQSAPQGGPQVGLEPDQSQQGRCCCRPALSLRCT